MSGETIKFSDNYKYLFPFEKVSCGSKIIIYGAGKLGQEYLKQIKMTNYCKVSAILDNDYNKYKSAVVPILPPENVSKLNFDKAVIALNEESEILKAKKILTDANISEENIVRVGERDASRISVYL